MVFFSLEIMSNTFWSQENNPTNPEEFDELSSLSSNDDNFIDQYDPFDDKYNDPEDLAAFAELLDTPSTSTIVPPHSAPAIVPIFQTRQPTRIQRKTPTTPLPDVPILIKVTHTAVVFRNRVPMAFKSAADPAHPTQRNYFGKMDVQCIECGAWHWSVERVNRLQAATKSNDWDHVFESCCKKGSVKLDAFQPPPAVLRNLLLNDSPRGVAFRQNIRQYNSALTFTSLGYKKDDCSQNQDGHGPWQCHGELYHMQGPLVADTPESAQYAQLFFYDPAYAGTLRHQRNQNLNLGILRELTNMLHDVNPFISIYKTAREQLQELENTNNHDV